MHEAVHLSCCLCVPFWKKVYKTLGQNTLSCRQNLNTAVLQLAGKTIQKAEYTALASAENSNPTFYAEIPPTLLLLAPLAHILHRGARQRWFRYQDCEMQGYTTRDCPANITTSATWGSEPKCTFITTAGIALALENSEAQKRARLENYDITTWRNARC